MTDAQRWQRLRRFTQKWLKQSDCGKKGCDVCSVAQAAYRRIVLEMDRLSKPQPRKKGAKG